jgi:dTDP-4-dehydrorhamnose 3,5-epimerase-like enzyme
MSVREMTVQPTEIAGLFLIEMKQVEDERGIVREFYRESSWLDAGLPSLGAWVQINVTEAKKGAVRGLHGEAITSSSPSPPARRSACTSTCAVPRRRSGEW